MTAPAPQAETSHLGKGRLIAVWTLIVLGALIGLLAILATWVNRQMFDDNSWNKASTQLIQDPAIQSALSVYLVNELYDNVDVPAVIAKRLPPKLKPLAAPAAAALRDPATNTVRLLLTRPRVQTLWVNASTVTHRELVNVLENKTGAGISTGQGDVTVDLGALLRQLAPQLGLPESAAAKIPAGTGVFTVMHSDQLGTAQTLVRLIRIGSVWLLVLTFLMFGAAIYIARGKRRETLRDIAWAFVFIGLIVLVVRRSGGNYAVNALTTDQYRKPGLRAWLIGSSILGELGWAVVFYGVIGLLGAVLAGPTRAATAVRRRIAPVLNERPGLAWGAAGLAYLLLVFWGGTHALRTPLGILLLAALLALGVYVFRRQTLAEFPDTTLSAEHNAALP